MIRIYGLILVFFLLALSKNVYSQASDTALAEKEYRTAFSYYDKKDYETALIHLNKGLEADPNSFHCHGLRADIYKISKKYEEAISEMSVAIMLNPNVALCYEIRGLCELKLERYPESISDFTKYLSFNPNNIDVLLYRELCYRKLDNYKEALRDINRVIKLEDKASHYLERAQVEYKLKYYSSCVADCNRYVKYGATDNMNILYYHRGSAYFDVGEYDSARVDLLEYEKYGKPMASVNTTLGYCYAVQQDSIQARNEIRKALEMDIDDIDTYYAAGYIELELKNCAKAKFYCEQYFENLGKKPARETIYNLRGQINACLGDTSKAIEDFNTAITINPRNVFPHYNKMNLLFDDTTRTKDIIKEIDGMIHSDVDSSEICFFYNLRAFVEIRVSDSTGALRDLEIAKKLSHNAAFVYYNMAIRYLYFETGDRGHEIEIFNNLHKAIMIDEKYIPAYKLLAFCYYVYKEDKRTACELVEKALKFSPGDKVLQALRKDICSRGKKEINPGAFGVQDYEFGEKQSPMMKLFVDDWNKVHYKKGKLHLL